MAEYELLLDDESFRKYRVINGKLIGFVTCSKIHSTPTEDDFEFEGEFGWPAYKWKVADFVKRTIELKPNNPPKNFVYGVG